MEHIILFLLPRMFCVIYMAASVCMFVKAKRRGRLEAWHYWLVGMSGYNIVAGWTWGMLYQCVETLFWLCVLGYVVSLLFCTYKQQRQAKASVKAAREAKKAPEGIEASWLKGDMSDDDCSIFLAGMRAKHGLAPLTMEQSASRHAHE